MFTSERGAPFTTAGFARMVEWAGKRPSCPLRRILTCSGMLAAMHWQIGGMIRGNCWPSGHKNIQHTVRYTELSPARFKNFWRK